MNIKKTLTIALFAALLLLTLAACGGGASDGAPGSSGGSGGSNAPAEPVTVTLGVVGAIYEDLWKSAQEALKAENINLEFVQFSDYVTPNNALANGDIDLNAFQHRIYLQSEIESYGYEIQTIGNTFIIPLNLYSQKVSSVEELKDGDVVAIPDDLTNGGRALKVLEAAGLIKISDAAGFNPTLEDIETYNVGITIEELKANVIPSALPDRRGEWKLRPGLRPEDRRGDLQGQRAGRGGVLEPDCRPDCGPRRLRQGGDLSEGGQSLPERGHGKGLQRGLRRVLH